MSASEKQCSYEHCEDPEEIGCNLGWNLAECKYWKAGDLEESTNNINNENQTKSKATAERSMRLPWTGNSLGLRDIDIVSASAPVTTIGIVGPYNAGKTTLLTFMYLLIQHGEPLAHGLFAGSSSLIGWENLAANLRWRPGAIGPTFPPHTSRNVGRLPGLLHLSLRDGDSVRRDFLFTDPPGEWFSMWSKQENADGAQGARWIQRHADRFIFLVDREALSSTGRGKARDDLRDLARRLSRSLGERPIAVVWTKSDIEISSIIEQDLKDCFAVEFPQYEEFYVRIRFSNSDPRSQVEKPCVALMNWIFSPQVRQTNPPFVLPVTQQTDYCLAYRGRR